MVHSIRLYVSMVVLIALISCTGSGAFDLGSNDTATLTIQRIDYSSSPPTAYMSTATYEEKEYDPAPMNYDPYLYADVDTFYTNHMHIVMRSNYTGTWERELDITVEETTEGTYTIGINASGSYREGTNTCTFTGGKVVITQVGGLGGYVKGSLDVTLSCSASPSPISTSYPLRGSFSITRAI